MNKIYILFFSISCVVLFLSNSNGALPENTGAPGDMTCGRAPCHNVAVNVGTAIMSITYNQEALQYMADSTYEVTISIADPQSTKNGFQIVALDSDNQNIGDWVLLEPTKMKIVPGIGLPNRKYVTHQAAGNMQNSWTIGWTAPSTNSGPVSFYAAVNSTNNNGMNSGDEIYTSSLSIDFAEPVTTFEPLNVDISIYPVPARAGTWLDLPEGKGEFQYALYTVDGQAVSNVRSATSGKHYIELQSLSKGIYFVKVMDESSERFIVKKLVVQ